MSLFEVSIASALLAMLLVGILSSLIQSRRLTEGSIYQNSALTIVQGYLEQIKNMEFTSLPYYSTTGSLVAGAGTTADEIQTRIDEVTSDVLRISSGSIPAMSAITPGAAGTGGIIDNNKIIDISQTSSTDDDLRLKLWVWITDISDASTDATQVRAITIIYQYRLANGANSRWHLGSVRSIRSSVPTF